MEVNDYTAVDKTTAERLMAKQNKAIYPRPFVRFGSDGVFLPDFFRDSAVPIRKMDVREDDLWICSFIKAGL